MNSTIRNFFLTLALLAACALSAAAQTRMQVSSSTPIRARADASAPVLGTANPGEILFVSSSSGAFSAIEPPDRIGLWLNKDFVEGNRVVAKSVQLRTGPGLEHDIAGSLSRGAAILKISEQGDWLQVSPPSSSSVYVLSSALQPVPVVTEPIRDVETVPDPVTEAPAEQPAAASAVTAPPPPPPADLTELATLPESAAPTSAPAPLVSPSVPGTEKPKPAHPVPTYTATTASAPTPAPVVHRAPPSSPSTPSIRPSAPSSAASSGSHASHASHPAPAPTKPIIGRPIKPAVPALRNPTPPPNAPAQSFDIPPTQAGATYPTFSAPALAPAQPHAAPPAGRLPAPHGAQQLTVPADLVADLDLDPDVSNQGKRVRVTGELRVSPLRSSSPSRYRLIDTSDGSPSTICDIHGRPDELRPYIGKTVTIRGQAFRITSSRMPVVVVGQLLPPPDAE